MVGVEPAVAANDRRCRPLGHLVRPAHVATGAPSNVKCISPCSRYLDLAHTRVLYGGGREPLVACVWARVFCRQGGVVLVVGFDRQGMTAALGSAGAVVYLVVGRLFGGLADLSPESAI